MNTDTTIPPRDPSRYEESRVAFEKINASGLVLNKRHELAGDPYRSQIAQWCWEAWCAALDYAARQAPEPRQSAVECGTPRTDEAQFGTGRVSVDFARTLERELAASEAREKRLREAIDATAKKCEGFEGCPVGPWHIADELRAALAAGEGEG